MGGLQVWAIVPVSHIDKDQTQDFIHAKQEFYQLNNIPRSGLVFKNQYL